MKLLGRITCLAQMLPIATDVERSVVGLSVCLSACVLCLPRVSCAKTTELIEISFEGADSRGWGVEILHEKRQFLGLSGPVKKHWESLLRCTQQKGSLSPQWRRDGPTVGADCNALNWSLSHYIVPRAKSPLLRCGLSSEFLTTCFILLLLLLVLLLPMIMMITPSVRYRER